MAVLFVSSSKTLSLSVIYSQAQPGVDSESSVQKHISKKPERLDQRQTALNKPGQYAEDFLFYVSAEIWFCRSGL